MNTSRSNQDWLFALRQEGEIQSRALAELRDFLLRSILLYLNNYRSDLRQMALTEVRDLAEDLAQESVLAVQERLDTFRGDSKFTTWAYRFAINRTISELRRRQYRTDSWEAISDVEKPTMVLLFEERLDPEQAAAVKGAIATLREIIQDELSERQRLAIRAIHFEGASMQETADELEISANALYKLLFDARQKVKAHLMLLYPDISELFKSFE